MNDPLFDHHFGGAGGTTIPAPQIDPDAMTPAKVEAIASAPWAYASADISAALRWGLAMARRARAMQ